MVCPVTYVLCYKLETMPQPLKTTYGILISISEKSQGRGCLNRQIFSIAILTLLAASAFAAAPTAAPQVFSPTHPDGPWSANNKPKFTWAAVEGAGNYAYSIDASPEAAPPAASANRTDRNYVVLPAVSDGQKYFHIVACNSDGCGPAGHFLVRIDTGPPKPVDGLAGEYQADGTVKLTWNDQNDTSGIAEYQVFRSSVQRNRNNRDFLPTDPGVRKYSITGTTLTDTDELREGAAFYYRALAVDSAGNIGAPSGVRTVRTFPPAGQEGANPNPTLEADINIGQAIVDVNEEREITDGGPPAAGQEGGQDTVITEKPEPKPQPDTEYAPGQSASPPANANPQQNTGRNSLDQPAAVAGLALIVLVAAGAAIAYFGMKPKAQKSPGRHESGTKKHGGAKWAARENAKPAKARK